MTVATVMTHRRPAETEPAIKILMDVARSVGARLLFDRSRSRSTSSSRLTGSSSA